MHLLGDAGLLHEAPFAAHLSRLLDAAAGADARLRPCHAPAASKDNWCSSLLLLNRLNCTDAKTCISMLRMHVCALLHGHMCWRLCQVSTYGAATSQEQPNKPHAATGM